MKLKLLFVAAVLLAFAAGKSFLPDTRPATVHKIGGLFVFWDCAPADDYETIGHIKIKGIVETGDYEDMLTRFLKKTKETYPNADGILYDHDQHNRDNVDVIKFK